MAVSSGQYREVFASIDTGLVASLSQDLCHKRTFGLVGADVAMMEVC